MIAERSLSAPRNGETFRPAAGAHGDHGLANRGVAQLVRNAQAVVEACRPKTVPDQNQPWDPTKCSTLMAALSLEKGCCGREAIQDCEAFVPWCFEDSSAPDISRRNLLEGGPQPVVIAARREVPAGVPCEDHCDHLPLGAVCDSCHRAPSVPMTKSCRRPSVSAATAGDPANPATAGAPCENHRGEPSLDPVWRRCHSDASSPTTNSSNGPSRPEATAGRSRRNFIPDGASCGLQPDQPPLGAVCPICHSLPSLPTTNSSRCPSAL